MNLADVVIIVILAFLFKMSVSSMKKGRSSCSKDCSSCHSSCSKIDWHQIQKDIHSQIKDQKNR